MKIEKMEDNWGTKSATRVEWEVQSAEDWMLKIQIPEVYVNCYS